jgi:ribosomal protein S18 acetylase RimI-like enzyme
MNEIIITHKGDIRFAELIKRLDEELYIKYGDIQKAYDKYNSVDKVEHVVLAICNGRAIGCGGYKKYDDISAEIKRVYVLPEYRSRGFAEKIMSKLHDKAKVCGYKKCILETGPQQKAAIRLYKRLGYMKIENYKPYIGMMASVCYEKNLQVNSLCLSMINKIQ